MRLDPCAECSHTRESHEASATLGHGPAGHCRRPGCLCEAFARTKAAVLASERQPAYRKLPGVKGGHEH